MRISSVMRRPQPALELAQAQLVVIIDAAQRLERAALALAGDVDRRAALRADLQARDVDDALAVDRALEGHEGSGTVMITMPA